MNRETIQKLLDEKQPFTIQLPSGRSIEVRDPHFCFLTRGGGALSVNVEGDLIEYVRVTLIESITAAA